jgi:hypothetical protein
MAENGLIEDIRDKINRFGGQADPKTGQSRGEPARVETQGADLMVVGLTTLRDKGFTPVTTEKVDKMISEYVGRALDKAHETGLIPSPSSGLLVGARITTPHSLKMMVRFRDSFILSLFSTEIIQTEGLSAEWVAFIASEVDRAENEIRAYPGTILYEERFDAAVDTAVAIGRLSPEVAAIVKNPKLPGTPEQQALAAQWSDRADRRYDDIMQQAVNEAINAGHYGLLGIKTARSLSADLATAAEGDSEANIYDNNIAIPTELPGREFREQQEYAKFASLINVDATKAQREEAIRGALREVGFPVSSSIFADSNKSKAIKRTIDQINDGFEQFRVDYREDNPTATNAQVSEAAGLWLKSIVEKGPDGRSIVEETLDAIFLEDKVARETTDSGSKTVLRNYFSDNPQLGVMNASLTPEGIARLAKIIRENGGSRVLNDPRFRNTLLDAMTERRNEDFVASGDEGISSALREEGIGSTTDQEFQKYVDDVLVPAVGPSLFQQAQNDPFGFNPQQAIFDKFRLGAQPKDPFADFKAQQGQRGFGPEAADPSFIEEDERAFNEREAFIREFRGGGFNPQQASFGLGPVLTAAEQEGASGLTADDFGIPEEQPFFTAGQEAQRRAHFDPTRFPGAPGAPGQSPVLQALDDAGIPLPTFGNTAVFGPVQFQFPDAQASALSISGISGEDTLFQQFLTKRLASLKEEFPKIALDRIAAEREKLEAQTRQQIEARGPKFPDMGSAEFPHFDTASPFLGGIASSARWRLDKIREQNKDFDTFFNDPQTQADLLAEFNLTPEAKKRKQTRREDEEKALVAGAERQRKQEAFVKQAQQQAWNQQRRLTTGVGRSRRA